MELPQNRIPAAVREPVEIRSVPQLPLNLALCADLSLRILEGHPGKQQSLHGRFKRIKNHRVFLLEKAVRSEQIDEVGQRMHLGVQDADFGLDRFHR